MSVLVLSADSTRLIRAGFGPCTGVTRCSDVHVSDAVDVRCDVGPDARVMAVAVTDSEITILVRTSRSDLVLEYGHRSPRGFAERSRVQTALADGPADAFSSFDSLRAHMLPRAAAGMVRSVAGELAKAGCRWQSLLRFQRGSASPQVACWTGGDTVGLLSGDSLRIHEIDVGASTVGRLDVCRPSSFIISSAPSSAFVACTAARDIREISILARQVIRTWRVPVTPDVLISAQDGEHLAAIQRSPAIMAIWELDHPRKTALVNLGGDTAIDLAEVGGRYLVALSSAGRSESRSDSAAPWYGDTGAGDECDSGIVRCDRLGPLLRVPGPRWRKLRLHLHRRERCLELHNGVLLWHRVPAAMIGASRRDAKFRPASARVHESSSLLSAAGRAPPSEAPALQPELSMLPARLHPWSRMPISCRRLLAPAAVLSGLTCVPRVARTQMKIQDPAEQRWVLDRATVADTTVVRLWQLLAAFEWLSEASCSGLEEGARSREWQVCSWQATTDRRATSWNATALGSRLLIPATYRSGDGAVRGNSSPAPPHRER